MPPLIVELHGSRTFDVNVTGGTAKFLYYVAGVESEADAYDLVLGTSPGTWYGYSRATIDMSNRPTLGQWFPVVNYEIPVYQPGTVPPTGDGPGGATPPAGGSPSTPGANDVLGGVSVSLTLEPQHYTASRKTVSRTGRNGAAAPDYGGLINVQEGKVEGVDVGVPVATLQVQSTLPYLTAGYFKNLMWVCGSTNLYKWWIFDEEEALFVGAQGQSKASGECELSYEFRYIKTVPFVSIDNGAIVTPEKRGHHYLWVSYKKRVDANELAPRPIAAYIEQVYDAKNFDWIGKIR